MEFIPSQLHRGESSRFSEVTGNSSPNCTILPKAIHDNRCEPRPQYCIVAWYVYCEEEGQVVAAMSQVLLPERLKLYAELVVDRLRRMYGYRCTLETHVIGTQRTHFVLGFGQYGVR